MNRPLETSRQRRIDCCVFVYVDRGSGGGRGMEGGGGEAGYSWLMFMYALLTYTAIVEQY